MPPLYGYGGHATYYPLDPSFYQAYEAGKYPPVNAGVYSNGHRITGIQTNDIPRPAGIRARLPDGTRLQNDRYVIEDLLGQGGMGLVYKVSDTHLGIARAMKEMGYRIGELGSELVNFPREAEMMMAQNHPGIPQVHDIFVQSDRSYIILDYIEGFTLQEHLMQSDTWLTQEEVGGWMFQLAEIVNYLHSQETPVIFRDLKPGNIMLTPDNRIVLIDFGIAKLFKRGVHNTTVGTDGYAAPEQRIGLAEPRSDIYALGAVMYQLLTRTLPRSPVSSYPPRQINPYISPEVERVILRCTELHPDRRYQSASEFQEALENALGIYAPNIVRPPQHKDGAQSSQKDEPSVGPSVGVGGRVSALWSAQTEGKVWGTPTIVPSQQGQEGTILIGSYDNNLHAFGLNRGDWQWMFATEGGICGKPVLWRNLVIFGSEDQTIYALDVRDGSEQWRRPTLGALLAAPCIFNDILYMGSDDGKLYALNPQDGEIFWSYPTYSPLRSSVAFANGMIYFGSCNGKLYALDAHTGELRWTVPTQDKIVSTPCVADNYVYFGSMDYHIYSVEAKNGWRAWDVRTEREVTSSPIVVKDQLFIGSGDGRLYCINSQSGRRIWTYQTQGQVVSTPAYADGVVYFGCTDKRVYALDAQKGRQIRWYFETKDMVVGSPVVHNGVVYIGSLDGFLYALRA